MRDDEWSQRPDDGEDFNNALHQRTEELYRIPDSIPDDKGIIECVVLPLRDLVVFPHMVSPIFVVQGSTLLAIQEAQANEQTVIGLVQKDPELEEVTAKDFLKIGVEMAVGRLISMPDGNSSALVQGRRRIELVKILREQPFMVARAKVIDEPTDVDKEIDALMRTTRNLFEKCVQLDRSLPEEAHLFAINISEPGWLSDMIATSISLSFKERQNLLMMTDPMERLKRVNRLLAQELDVLQLEDEIQNRVQSEVDRSQREFYLREQMKAIQNELGEGDVWAREIAELKEKIEKAGLPTEVKAAADKEIERLTQMPPLDRKSVV
jgi:ATP-dependent Lon protease